MGRVPKGTERRIRLDADQRCGYCLSSQKYVLGLLELEHILPEALGGTNVEENLWLACPSVMDSKVFKPTPAIRLPAAEAAFSIRAVRCGIVTSSGVWIAHASRERPSVGVRPWWPSN